MALSSDEIDRFVEDGYVRLDDAFSAAQAKAALAVILPLAGINPLKIGSDPIPSPVKMGSDPIFREPVVRVDGSGDPAVVATINTPRLTTAIDQLVGEEQWQRRGGFGTFPIRFPSDADPGDTGWHIDGSFGEAPHYRVNWASRGRALLLLMLYTDVTERDAPTRIRVGSHVPVGRALEAMATEVVFVPERHSPEALDLPIDLAIGPAGTVYLCHPFLVHAASWPHEGSGPRVIAQPCIHHPEGEGLGGFNYAAPPDSPVKRATRHTEL